MGFPTWNLLGSGTVRCKNQLLRQGQAELFATKQHIKAYTSAMASWVKAYITRLILVAAAAEAGSEPDLDGMVMPLKQLLWTLLPVERWKLARRTVHTPPTEVAWGSSSSSLHLMEQVWVARAVAALAQQLLQSQPLSGCTTDDSASNNSSGSEGRGNWGTNGAGLQGGAGNNSSSVGVSLAPARPEGKYDVIETAGVQRAIDSRTCSSRAGAVEVALCLHMCLSQPWHAAATAAHEQAADQQSVAATTASLSHLTVGKAPNSLPVSAPPAAHIEQLFGTSSMSVLWKGLPAAVVNHLEQLKGRWPFGVLRSKEPVEDQQVQLMVLHDVVGLCN